MANALSREKSPYLLQHAGNPVDWLPWGDEAFARARDEDKPVFLSIGYATCHWCHVMAHESFEDQEVAALLNENFIPIKVDREERPDVDSVYMTVCQALTGAGGWPLSLFLAPDKKPFYAGTYFPKNNAMGRPGMVELLTQIARMWQEERPKLINAGEEITKAVSRIAPNGHQGEPDIQAMEKAYWSLAQRFDPRRGGFGKAPKFPTPHNLNFLLRWHQRGGKDNSLEMVEATLKAMRKGGIFDQVGLGFHRYSVDDRWLVPHFEKMLYDQALLAYAYLEAYQVTGEEAFADTAREIFTYVLRGMTSPEGGFFSAEDADSDGEEGLFYVWTLDEIQDALDEDEAKTFITFYGVSQGGNFEGRNIPFIYEDLETFAGRRDKTPEEIAAILESARKKLFALREKRNRPLLDDKVLTAWNGLMIAALAKGAAVLGEAAYLEAAQKAVRFVLERLSDGDGGLLRSWREGQASGPGYLEDYAFMIWGLIDLHQAGQDPAHLAEALRLAEECAASFEDEVRGGFFFTPHHGEELIIREKDAYDGATPSGNSVMAWNLIRLARITGQPSWEKKGSKIMSALSAEVSTQPAAHTFLLWALDLALAQGAEVVIAGDPDDPRTGELLDAARQGFNPQAVVLLKPVGNDNALSGLAPFTEEMTALEGGPAAYVCKGHACQRPVGTVAELRELLS